MKPFEFHCPTKIICGKESLHKLPDALEEHKVKKPLLVTDGNLVKLGVAKHVTDPLEEANISYVTYDKVPPDSSLDVVNEVAALYRDNECDGWIALGGGSVIDTTKGAAASISVGGKDFATLQGAEILKNQLDPFIAIPTTAGTGSEVTLVAVIADTQAQAKLSYTSYRLVPHVAILDPALTSSLPPRLTATTGIDALTHAIEAYTSIQKNPISDALALYAIKIINQNLAKACAEPGDLDARTNLAIGSLIAGASFSNAMVGVVHALGHSLGGLCHIPHGHAMMLLLPHCIRYNISHGYHAGLYGELLSSLCPDKDLTGLTASDKDHLFETELFAINEFYHNTYGVAITLSELGVTKEDLPAVAKQARYDGAALYNEQEITEEVAMSILEAAF